MGNCRHRKRYCIQVNLCVGPTDHLVFCSACDRYMYGYFGGSRIKTYPEKENKCLCEV